MEVLKLHKCDTNRGSRKGGEQQRERSAKTSIPVCNGTESEGCGDAKGRRGMKREPTTRTRGCKCGLTGAIHVRVRVNHFFRTRSVCCPSAPTAFKPSTLRDCNYACLLGLGLCTSRLQFSRFLEYGCTVLYNGVLSMRTRLLKPCAAQICCSDGVLKNVLCMSECLGGSSDCI